MGASYGGESDALLEKKMGLDKEAREGVWCPGLPWCASSSALMPVQAQI